MEATVTLINEAELREKAQDVVKAQQAFNEVSDGSAAARKKVITSCAAIFLPVAAAGAGFLYATDLIPTPEGYHQIAETFNERQAGAVMLFKSIMSLLVGVALPTLITGACNVRNRRRNSVNEAERKLKDAISSNDPHKQIIQQIKTDTPVPTPTTN